MTDEYELDRSMKEKPVLNVDDLYIVLYHLWAVCTAYFQNETQRLQLALAILICAYTAARPGCMVYVKKNQEASDKLGWESQDPMGEDDEDVVPEDLMDVDPAELEELMELLCYKHITLVLLATEDDQSVIAMEVDLQFTKGHKRRFKR
jgi:hypothetical protein